MRRARLKFARIIGSMLVALIVQLGVAAPTALAKDDSYGEDWALLICGCAAVVGLWVAVYYASGHAEEDEKDRKEAANMRKLKRKYGRRWHKHLDELKHEPPASREVDPGHGSLALGLFAVGAIVVLITTLVKMFSN